MKRHYYPALGGIFGDWVYYSCLMSMREVTERLRFASEIHKPKALRTGYSASSREKRSKQIADYLLGEAAFLQFDGRRNLLRRPGWHGFSHLKPVTTDIDLEDVPDDVEASVGF